MSMLCDVISVEGHQEFLYEHNKNVVALKQNKTFLYYNVLVVHPAITKFTKFWRECQL